MSVCLYFLQVEVFHHVIFPDIVAIDRMSPGSSILVLIKNIKNWVTATTNLMQIFTQSLNNGQNLTRYPHFHSKYQKLDEF